MGALVLPRAGQPGLLQRPRCAARLPRATLRPLALRAPVLHASIKPKQPSGWRVQQPRRGVQCAGSPKEDEVETLPALTALTESEQLAGYDEGESSYDEEEVENNPELHPLKEALQRARARREEATSIREAMEAEAQEVAQLAVNAQEGFQKVKGSLETTSAELKAAEAAVQQAQGAVEVVRERMRVQKEEAEAAEAAAAAAVAAAAKAGTAGSSLGQRPASGGTGFGVPAVAGGTAAGQAALTGISPEDAAKIDEESALLATMLDAGADGKTCRVVVADSTLEDLLWQRVKELEAAEKKLQQLTEQRSSLQAKAAAAEDAFFKAEEIASAAMEAAEEAVRDEMECITVAKETESALLKAIEDLRFLDESSERQEESIARRVQKATATRTMDEEAVAALAAAAGAGAKAAAPAAAKAAKPDTARQASAKEEEKEEPKGIRQLAILFHKYKYVLLGGAVLVAAGGFALQQSGALAALTAQAQAAAASVARLWSVAVTLVRQLPWPHIHDSEKGLLQAMQLLAASVVAVPLICKLPGGSPVLGFLAGGAMIGPYALGIIQDVESIRHLAELGVVFLLFNIGLELSFDRLRSMQKYVFGMGTAQVVSTLAAVAYTALAITGGAVGGPGAIILGGGLALSTTAVGMQVLQDRGETGSRHGRATFSVLLFQDLAVVVLLMLIPLLAPSPDQGAGVAGLVTIAKAVGVAAVKAVITMAAIIYAGRTLLRPIYRRVADTHNAEIFAATTLLVVLGTSLFTQIAGLSLALGAFLAGLLLAETEFHLQVESDIAPYKGLLMGLFFMTVGMEISFGLLFAKFRLIMGGIALLIAGKVAIMGAVGQAFGLTLVQSLRSGLLLAPGGEFAFVLFGEAVSKGIMGSPLAKELYLVVALSMALTPFLAEFGQKLAKQMEKTDMKALQPSEGETAAISDHVIIAGFGRVGQMIAQMLSKKMIPFVALDVRTDRVQAGKEQDLPVYFGDAGSAAVLHAVGAERAACAVITLDTPGANYRSVWAMHKHFPNVRTFVRAHDIANGITLEKAGATAVVPETLEPSLQLAAAVLSELNMNEDDVAETVRSFRKLHLADLQMLAEASGSSLGYGASPAPKKDTEDGSSTAAPVGSNGSSPSDGAPSGASLAAA